MKHGKLAYRTNAYVSEFEQFIDQYMADHPTVAAAQRRGWRLWWDRPVEMSELAVRRDDAVPVKGYPYQ